MIRVMQINQGEKFGGVSAMLYQLYLNIDREKIQFDFVAPKRSSFSIYKNEIENMGGRIFELKADGNIFVRKYRFWKRLKRHIDTNKYEIVHINSGSILFNVQCAWIAKKCGVRKIIVHSHNAGTNNGMKRKIMRITRGFLEIGTTDFFACSHKAAEYMFIKKRVKEKKYQIINNGVDTDRFVFDPDIREAYRREMNIENKQVILHTGRFSQQKNHAFLLKILKKYVELYPKTVLLLAGAGELENDIKSMITDMKLEKNVKMLGLRQDIPSLMSASDVLVLPSLFEGLPVVGIEAQANGLPCIFSDEITREADVTGYNKFVALRAPVEKWCEVIHDAVEKFPDRGEAANKIEEKEYSIKQSAKKLQEFYLN